MSVKWELQNYNLWLLRVLERQEFIRKLARITNEIDQVKRQIGEASGNNGQLYKRLRELQVHQLWLLEQVEWDSDDVQ